MILSKVLGNNILRNMNLLDLIEEALTNYSSTPYNILAIEKITVITPGEMSFLAYFSTGMLFRLPTFSRKFSHPMENK